MMPAESPEHDLSLPTSEQTLLLRSCLLDGAVARDSWDAWLANIGDPIDRIRCDYNGLRRLLPLLYVAARRNRYSIDGRLRTTLRTAYVRERWRIKIYNELLGRVSDALNSAGIDSLLLNGAALANTVYEDPVARHCHDIDLLTNEEGMARAGHALLPLDFRHVIRDSRRARFEHSSNLPLELYTRLRYQEKTISPFAVIFAESVTREIGGRSLHTLSPAPSLLQICSAPPTRERDSILSAFCDAWYLVRRYPDLSWSDVVDAAYRFGVAARSRAVLSYLRETLHASVPQWPESASEDARQMNSGSRRVPTGGK